MTIILNYGPDGRDPSRNSPGSVYEMLSRVGEEISSLPEEYMMPLIEKPFEELQDELCRVEIMAQRRQRFGGQDHNLDAYRERIRYIELAIAYQTLMADYRRYRENADKLDKGPEDPTQDPHSR